MIKKLFILSCSINLLTATPQKMVVNVPIADLRITPIKVPAGTIAPALSMDMGGRDVGQITQLLFNEPVITDQDETCPAGWLKATAQEQFNGFGDLIPSGYIEASQAISVENFPKNTLITKEPIISSPQLIIPMGSYLQGLFLFSTQDKTPVWLVNLPDKSQAYLPASKVYEINELKKYTEQQTRDALVATARKLLDTKFVWGGRSIALPELSEQVTGVDNSGFVHLVFRILNINIPRNTKHILLKSLDSPVADGKDVKPGDVLFFVKPNLLTNVGIYLGNNEFIYATGNPTGEDFNTKNDYSAENQKKLCVQIAPLSDFFTTPITNLKNGDSPAWVNPARYSTGSKIFFGNFIAQTLTPLTT